LSAVLLGFTALVYSNSFGVGFPVDNNDIILQDPRVPTVTSLTLHRIFTQQYWEIASTGLYRPLTTLSYHVQLRLSGHE
jgi:hypothetical protein